MRTCSAALVVSVLVLGGSLRAETPPNIILIYTDDFPWFGTSVQMQAGDVGSHTPYQRSPNIDRLASEGLTFSRAYAPAGMCGPSRASLQLGQSTARSRYTANAGNSNGTEVPGIEQNGGGELLNEPTSLIHLPSERTTVGEALQAQGYATAHFGKWHLWGGGPENHGYDVSDGETNNTPGNTNPDPINDPKLMFSITQDSIDFMQQQNAADKPFFIQMSHYATHGGFQYRPETYEYYENLQAINDQVPESGQNTARETAAMFEDLDTTIGMVLDEVDNLGIADNTYVVFTSDNGMGRNLGNNYLRGAKWWLWDAALRVPMIVRGPDIPAGTRTDTNVVQYDYMPTFVDWAGGDLESLPDDIDGVSLRGLMENPEVDPDYEGRSLYFHYPHTRNSTPQSAVVKGTEKLIIFYEDTDKLYYFDTSVDPFESFNISEFDDRAQELREEFDQYLADVREDEFLYPVENPTANSDLIPFDAARDYLPREYFGEVPEMQGDLTGDGVVDTADLNALAAVWGADTGAAESFLARHQAGDINYDGATDWFDIILLRELVTAQAASAAIGAAVPEPTTLCLLAAAAATPLQRRRVVRRAS